LIFNRSVFTKLGALAALCMMPLLTGCVGLYNNTANFREMPREGMAEIDMIRTYGAPDFTTFVEDQKVYVYKVRDTKYIILVGIYDGYDYVITTDNGRIVHVERVDAPNTLAILQPLPWAVRN